QTKLCILARLTPSENQKHFRYPPTPYLISFATRSDSDRALANISRKPAPAAEPDVFLRLQPRHRQQVLQMVEPVPRGECGQSRERLGNEARGLVGAALARRLAGGGSRCTAR